MYRKISNSTETSYLPCTRFLYYLIYYITVVHLLQLICQFRYMTIGWSPCFMFSLSFYLKPFFCCRVPSRTPHSIHLSCLLGRFWLWQFLDFPISHDLATLRMTGWLLVECPSIEICLMITLGLHSGCVFWEEAHRLRVPFSPRPVRSTCSEHDLALLLLAVTTWPGSLPFSGFSTLGPRLSLPFLHCTQGQEVTMHPRHLAAWG